MWNNPLTHNVLLYRSLQMGHRDLAEFYRDTGDFQAALKNYTKAREYCTSSQHILDTCLSILELLIEQRQYAHIPTYTFKAESALDAITAIRPPNPQGAGGNGGDASAARPSLSDKEKERLTAEKDRTQTKLDLSAALSYFGQGNYDKAAGAFIKLGPVKYLENWGEKVCYVYRIYICCNFSLLSKLVI